MVLVVLLAVVVVVRLWCGGGRRGSGVAVVGVVWLFSTVAVVMVVLWK